MRVLLIEDDDDIRDVLAIELQAAGHLTSCATDGAKAWGMLTSGAAVPDVILLDLLMPNMDGRTFRRRQLEHPQLSSIPTVVMTATDVDALTRQALGARAVLRKPFEIGTLIAVLSEAAARRELAKTCGCCGRRYNLTTWRTLRTIGESDNGRAVGERIELRQCHCRSTLAWQVGPHALSCPMLIAPLAP